MNLRVLLPSLALPCFLFGLFANLSNEFEWLMTGVGWGLIIATVLAWVFEAGPER